MIEFDGKNIVIDIDTAKDIKGFMLTHIGKLDDQTEIYNYSVIADYLCDALEDANKEAREMTHDELAAIKNRLVNRDADSASHLAFMENAPHDIMLLIALYNCINRETKHLYRERDALVSIIKDIGLELQAIEADNPGCKYCRHLKSDCIPSECDDVYKPCHFEWRGVQEAENNA